MVRFERHPQNDVPPPERVRLELRYQPLNDTEIRLLKFHSQQSPGDYLKCTLQHFKLDESLEFHALSYVWGDPKKTKPILVNNRKFEVTENLHDALNALWTLTPANVWWWIDSICINQQNIAERSTQVSRMAQIYSTARSVTSWLGSDIENIELVDYVARSVEKLGPQKARSFYIREELGDNWSKFLWAFGGLLIKDWFFRIWTVQEYALNVRQLGIVGGHVICMPVLPVIIEILIRMKSILTGKDSVAVSIINQTMIAVGLDFLRLEISREDWKDRSFAEQMLFIMKFMSNREATQAHDYIYGLLGMTSRDKLPPALTPDYSLPFGRVYQDYTRYLIENTGDLRILDCGESRLENFPSWVPDLRKRRTWRKAPCTTNSVSFSGNGDMLTVQGVRVGRILAYCTKDGRHPVFFLVDLQEAILDRSALIRRMSAQDVFREWIGFLRRKAIWPMVIFQGFDQQESLYYMSLI